MAAAGACAMSLQREFVVFADVPGSVRNRESGERAAAGPMAAGAVGRRRALLGLAVLRDDGQRLLERVRRRADHRRASLLDRRRGPLLVRLLAPQPARERRGKSTLHTLQ